MGDWDSQERRISVRSGRLGAWRGAIERSLWYLAGVGTQAATLVVASLLCGCPSYPIASTCWAFDSEGHPESCKRFLVAVTADEQRVICGSSAVTEDECRIDARVARCVFMTPTTGAAFAQDFYGTPVGSVTPDAARSMCGATAETLGPDWSFSFEVN